MTINTKGTLIVIDGIDGTGKHTQSEALYHTLITKYNLTPGKDIAMVSFPRYETVGCTMVEKYLNGDFCSDPNKIDPYTASMFYMIDQSISYKTEAWGDVYRNGGIVIADRYYTSNIIHQGAKILKSTGATALDDAKTYIDWLVDTSLNKVNIPSPDLVCWLICNKESNTKLLAYRNETDSTHKTDIHESNNEYLDDCRKMLDTYHYLVKSCEAYGDITNNRIQTNSSHEVFINILDKVGTIKSVNWILDEILQNVYNLDHFNK